MRLLVIPVDDFTLLSLDEFKKLNKSNQLKACSVVRVANVWSEELLSGRDLTSYSVERWNYRYASTEQLHDLFALSVDATLVTTRGTTISST